jgi:hypothetical protein
MRLQRTSAAEQQVQARAIRRDDIFARALLRLRKRGLEEVRRALRIALFKRRGSEKEDKKRVKKEGIILILSLSLPPPNPFLFLHPFLPTYRSSAFEVEEGKVERECVVGLPCAFWQVR